MIDKHQIAANFSKAASTYDEYAFVQREIGDRLFERLDLMKIKPECIVDIGCGTGWFTRKLKKRFSRARVCGVDIAPGMLTQAKNHNGWFGKCQYELADMDRLPFSDQSVDLLFSNLSLQWSLDLKKTMTEFSRVLKPSGLLLFSTLGPDTLQELKLAFSRVDQRQHVNDFLDMHHVGDAMLSSGLYQPVMDREALTFEYETVKGILKDLKGIGANSLNGGRSTGLMSKGQWQSLVKAYDAIKASQSSYPVTYEALFGHAWGAQASAAVASDTYPISLS